MRAVIVSVDYSDILQITLPYNRGNFSEVCVVTSTKDYPNVQAIADPLACKVVATDLFYAKGAVFNKWAALEFGLDCFGRKGWMCLLDADILWPQHASASLLRILRSGFLYCPRRRMITDVTGLTAPPPEETWGNYPLHRQEREFAGYSQIFHGSDPVLGSPPWHDTSWIHAGGADSFFQAKWPESRKIRPGFQVLHLGSSGMNWCGRSSAYLDGKMPEKGQERYQRLQQFMQGRRRRTTDDPFAHEKLPRK